MEGGRKRRERKWDETTQTRSRGGGGGGGGGEGGGGGKLERKEDFEEGEKYKEEKITDGEYSGGMKATHAFAYEKWFGDVVTESEAAH